MKTRKIFFALLIFLVSLQIGFGQDELPKAILVDDFGKICSEDFMARYDAYLVTLHNDPTAMGYIVVYGDESVEGRNLKYIEAIKGYTRFRRFDIARIQIIRGANQAGTRTQFWIVPAGADIPKLETVFTEPVITSTTRFDNVWADFYRGLDGSKSLQIYSEGLSDLGCGFAPNLSAFAAKLLSNPGWTGYLIVYTEFGKGAKRGNQVAAFAVNDLVKNHKITRNRLKTIYGGNRQEPEIDFWFVPKGDKPPVPNPDAKPKK